MSIGMEQKTTHILQHYPASWRLSHFYIIAILMVMVCEMYGPDSDAADTEMDATRLYLSQQYLDVKPLHVKRYV